MAHRCATSVAPASTRRSAMLDDWASIPLGSTRTVSSTWRSRTARSPSSPRPTPSWSARCTAACSRASSTRSAARTVVSFNDLRPPRALPVADHRRPDRALAGNPSASRRCCCHGRTPVQFALTVRRQRGGPAMITLTDTAADKVRQLINAEGDDALALRVAVRPGGCSGFSYEMFFDTDVADDDVIVEHGDVQVIVDPSSAQLLDRRHARLQGRPRPVRVRDHEPQRAAHLRLRPVLQLTGRLGAAQTARASISAISPGRPRCRRGRRSCSTRR